MSFLAPAFWIGLFLATLPVLIHLLGRRRLRRQPFSSLEFLQRLQTKRMRRLRLKQILLLILRTLAVLALALAFLRPALQTIGFAGAGSSATVILADQSVSMDARRNGSVPVERLEEAAQEIWQAGGEVGLVTAAEDGSRDVALRNAAGDVPRWLQDIETDGRAENIAPAMLRALKQLENSSAATKEIVVLSDFTSLPPDTVPSPGEQVKLWRFPLATESAMNLAVTDIRLGQALLRGGTTAELEVELRQFGGTEPVPVLVTVSLNERVVAEGEVTVPEQGPAAHTFSFRVPAGGRHAGSVELDVADALYADNLRYFVITVPGQRRVLLAGDDLGGLRYAELALNPRGTSSAFDVEVRPGPLRNIAQLNEYDAILYAGATSPTTADARRLKQYVSQGGGLWLVLGESADLAAWSRTLLPEFGFGGLVSEGLAKGVRPWEDLDRSHPALSALFEGQGRYDRPRVQRVYQAAPGSGANILVRLSDGTPFLIERTSENGRIWFTPSAFDTDWTDWPLSGVFAPMMQQGMLWLSGGEPQASEVICGEPIVWPMPENAPGETGGEVIAPMGHRVTATPSFQHGRQVWLTETTRWPGVYELLMEGDVVNVAAANVPFSESELQVRESGWPGDLLKTGPEETLSEALVRQRVGKELTPWLLLIALLALVAESLVARDRKQEAPARQPSPVQS